MKLIKMLKNGEEIKASDNDFAVEFTKGPIDGMLGSYDRKKRLMKIDVLEIFFYCCKNNPDLDGKELYKKFDLEVTRILAHEGGHWQHEKRYGVWPIVEKAILYLIFFSVGLVVFSFSVFYGFKLLLAIYAFADKTVPFAPHIVSFVAGFVLIRIFLKISQAFFAIWHLLSFFVSYQICFAERYARKCEKLPEENSDWNDVILVGEEIETGID